MVPIVSSRANQVVLIGDHKQLCPIILDNNARNLGLEKSLFERYSEKAKMLTVQYRMVSTQTDCCNGRIIHYGIRYISIACLLEAPNTFTSSKTHLKLDW